MKYIGGDVLTVCPLLPSNKALHSVGGIVVHALSLKNEKKNAPSLHSSAFFH